MTAHDSPKVPSFPPLDGPPLQPRLPRRGFFCLCCLSSITDKGLTNTGLKNGQESALPVTQPISKRHRQPYFHCLECVHALTAHDSLQVPSSPPWMGFFSTRTFVCGFFLPGLTAVTQGHIPSRAVTGCYRLATDRCGAAPYNEPINNNAALL